MTRIRAAAAVAAAAVLLLAGCSTGGGDAIASKAPTTVQGTVSFWHFFTGREAGVLKTAVTAFEKANPKVHVVIHDGQDDEKLQKAISAGQPIDLGLSYSTDIVGTFCSTGAFRDLKPYIARDRVDLGSLPAAVRSYTQYKGKRCVLPVLSDATALYMNTDLLQKAGISTPPKTLDELEADALKLTTYNPDGSIKTLGFNPLMGFQENTPQHFSAIIDGKFLDAKEDSVIGKSADWKALMQWQKGFVDRIGYAKLQRFTAGLGQEFAADTPFEKGRIAMVLDGEWRTAFIASDKADVQYATAPFPTASNHTDMYGATYITGNIAGIGKGATNPEAAWALLKYLALDTRTQVLLGNGLKNVPTLTSALNSSDLQVGDQYKTFVDAAKNPRTITSPASKNGAAYLNDFEESWDDYQTHGGDLDAILKKLDSTIDDANALSGP
ncbi:extracellular solute-binding protein [Amnibacterium kyonggiense]|uniref:Probable sugar-binding periplasmic protein n=1 Tax=Amnibacterium kyonggiense TaxID=595671 RepID=A0A4R7FLN3_9MICO|nr:extracellular solute-binding protein [Amnibacterium kyonggiense]TDS77286.1 carbohydrate ABC transporter substrate-binding protein (CUT1 family) [Amnibacterium kyonggiense]